MALIKCSECDKEVSSKAVNCPSCGNPIKKEKKKSGGCLKLFILIFLGALVVTSFMPSNKKSSVSKTYSVNHEKVKQLFNSDKEKMTKDSIWTTRDIFKVGVLDNGSNRDGYASYVCQVLYDYGFKGKRVWVQVIDIAKLVRNGKWEKLGDKHCL